jgi:hydroxyacylglutathione hydrolase
MRMLNVIAVPAFEDNYVWLIHDGVSAAVVDPGDAAPVLAALQALGLSLIAILLTHHHADHIGGVQTLVDNYPVPVFGPAHDAIPLVTVMLRDGDIAEISGLNLTFDVLDVPGHTLGHIAYVEVNRPWLFCGDTLFAAGCGRLFEGTPLQMVRSLAKFTALPDETLVFAAHEYTLANLQFAAEVEPDNPHIAARIIREKNKRNEGLPTLPSTIGLEKSTNPFLRCTEPVIVNRLLGDHRIELDDPIEVFTALRTWKNSFR